eukprot:132939_1
MKSLMTQCEWDHSHYTPRIYIKMNDEWSYDPPRILSYVGDTKFTNQSNLSTRFAESERAFYDPQLAVGIEAFMADSISLYTWLDNIEQNDTICEFIQFDHDRPLSRGSYALAALESSFDFENDSTIIPFTFAIFVFNLVFFVMICKIRRLVWGNHCLQHTNTSQSSRSYYITRTPGALSILSFYMVCVLITPASSECNDTEYACANSPDTCIPLSWMCDGVVNCPNEEDEERDICGVPCSESDSPAVFPTSSPIIPLPIIECGNSYTQTNVTFGAGALFSFTMPTSYSKFKISTCYSENAEFIWPYLCETDNRYECISTSIDESCPCSQKSAMISATIGNKTGRLETKAGIEYTFAFFHYYTGNSKFTVECGDSLTNTTCNYTYSPTSPTGPPPTSSPVWMWMTGQGGWDNNDPTVPTTRSPTFGQTRSGPTCSPTNEPTRSPTSAPSTSPTQGPLHLECPYNTLKYFGASKCFICNANDNGYECQGGTVLVVEYGHWISVHKKDESTLSSVYLIDDSHENDTIISLRCPSGQCCDNHKGCNYFESRVCAKNRNISSVTCSRCNDGYEELLATSVCGKCKDTDYLLVVLLFILAFAFTSFLLFYMSRPSTFLLDLNSQKNEINWRKLSLHDHTSLLSVLVIKNCMYYYQGLSQILFTQNITPSSEFQTSLLTLFNFDISLFSANGSGKGICFIGAIHSGIYKLLISYTWYVFVAFNVLIIAFITRARCFNIKPYIRIGCINIILMTAGPLLSNSFKILTCFKFIDDKYYHFYDADIACYGTIWWLAGLIPIVVLCSSFILFWHTLYKQDAHQKSNEHNPYRALTKRFKPNMWYWEFVLFFRRFSIAALTSFYGVADVVTSIILASFIVFLLALQTKFYPFKHERADQMESICLFGIVAIIIALIVMEDDSTYISLYLSFLILVPPFIVSAIVAITVYKWYTTRHIPLDDVRVQALKQRYAIELQPVSLPVSSMKTSQYVSLKKRIEGAESFQQMIPVMEMIESLEYCDSKQMLWNDLKQMLLEYCDKTDTTGHTTIMISSRVTNAVPISSDTDAYDVQSTAGAIGEDVEELVVDTMELAENSSDGSSEDDDVSPQNGTAITTMSNEKQQQLIGLYETDRNVWRKKITAVIREYKQEFEMILDAMETDLDAKDASLTMNKFENALSGLHLNNALIGCIFEDIGSFEGNGLQESTQLKITTIWRWIDVESVTFRNN